MYRSYFYGLLVVTALAAVLVGVLEGEHLDEPSVLSAQITEPVSTTSIDPGRMVEPTTKPTTTRTTTPFIEHDANSATDLSTTTTVAPTTTVPPTTTTSGSEQPAPTQPTTTAPPQPAVTGGFDAAYESEFAAKINGLRSSNGLAALTRDGSLDAEARAWAKRMAEQGALSHSNIGRFLPRWSVAAENVGAADSVSALFGALTGSSGHRANMVGGYTHVGIGVWVDGSGTLWTAHVFTG